MHRPSPVDRAAQRALDADRFSAEAAQHWLLADAATEAGDADAGDYHHDQATLLEKVADRARQSATDLQHGALRIAR